MSGCGSSFKLNKRARPLPMGRLLRRCHHLQAPSPVSPAHRQGIWPVPRSRIPLCRLSVESSRAGCKVARCVGMLWPRWLWVELRHLPRRRQMPPDSTRSDHPQVTRIEAELAHEVRPLLARLVAPPDIADLCFGEARLAVSDAGGGPSTSLRDAVLDVLGPRAKEQMVKPDTCWYIASVQDTRVGVSYGAVRQLPRDAVGEKLASSDADDSVATLIDVRAPQPAARSFLYFWPEPFFQWDRYEAAGHSIALHRHALYQRRAIRIIRQGVLPPFRPDGGT
jgi:hypothetical protein